MSRLRAALMVSLVAWSLVGAAAEALTGEQAVVVVSEGWGSVKATMMRFERVGPRWRRVGEAAPVVLGRAGLGWGKGMHPEGEPGPGKAEGDGRAPAGIFALGGAMGYAAKAPPGVRIAYTPSTSASRCVDDVRSPQYNQMVEAPSGQKTWGSAEIMRRKDHLYRWLVTVDHNHLLGGSPERGAGSCIFLHIWRSPKKGTSGCTAMAEPALRELMGWLRPEAKPALVQLPRAVYRAKQASWGLPPLPQRARGGARLPEGLVDAAAVVPRLQVELKYATTDNFLGQDVYEGLVDRCLLQSEAAQMLGIAAEHLKARAPGLRLHAYDCGRPRSVQKQMWAVVKGTPQAPYVANPDKGAGSIHNYGCAVDLTLADEGGRPVDMGTDFDHFGPEAEPRREGKLRAKGKLTAAQWANRLLLREVMVRAGFVPLENEWWHFNCASPKETRRRFPVIE